MKILINIRTPLMVSLLAELTILLMHKKEITIIIAILNTIHKIAITI